MKQLRSVGVHDGSFHADEVTACGLLIMCNLVDRDKIYRSRNPKVLALCEYVCDVGGEYNIEEKKFDHHQSSYTGRFSSAGMILAYLKDKRIIPEEEYSFFNSILIKGIDDQDNGRFFSEEGFCSFSDIIKIYNVPEEEQKNLDKAFDEALDFTLNLLKKMHSQFIYNQEYKKVLAKEMQNSSLLLKLDKKPLSWLENFFSLGGENHSALFILFPCNGLWMLRGIPPNFKERMNVRISFPESWSGLLGKDLYDETGIEGAVFCHKGLFTSVWRTKEAAIEALKLTLDMKGIPYNDNL